MVKKLAKVTLRCTACKQIRDITIKQFAKGQPFCPRCGNREVEVKAVDEIKG
jgi:rRNA maturation endonuclease Nob1